MENVEGSVLSSQKRFIFFDDMATLFAWPRVEMQGSGSLPRMLIVQVQVQVLPERIEAFRAATLANARESVREPGVARFDVIQDADDPTRFVLAEVYRTEAAPAVHKETAHYQRWRDAVADMMAVPRQSRKFRNVFPDD